LHRRSTGKPIKIVDPVDHRRKEQVARWRMFHPSRDGRVDNTRISGLSC
jgi:hypothetical protein